MSSLHSGLVSNEMGGSLTRGSNTLKSSLQNLARKQNTTSGKATSQKRLGTPIKFKRGSGAASYGIQTIIDDDEDDEMIQNLTKEIEELRAKRLSHDLYKRSTLDDDDDDDFETAIFAETLLGELGSSSGSHKDAFENDDEHVLDGDSGSASARG